MKVKTNIKRNTVDKPRKRKSILERRVDALAKKVDKILTELAKREATKEPKRKVAPSRTKKSSSSKSTRNSDSYQGLVNCHPSSRSSVGNCHWHPGRCH